MLTSNVKFWPALMRTVIKLVRSILGGALRGLTVTGGVVFDGTPGPALFTARTLNSYVSPSIRSGTAQLVLLAGTSHALSQPPYLSFFSITYFVIGDPPSVLGGSHLRSTLFWS